MTELEKGKVINVQNLIENFYWVVDENSRDTIFKFRPSQLKVYNKIKWCKENKKKVRLILLKARQLGMSTFTEALGSALAITKRNQDMLIMSHRADTSDHLFQMTHNFISHLPPELKPDVLKDNENEFYFNNKDRTGLNSQIKVMTANKKNEDGVGRGHRYTFVHMSEYDFWDCDASKVMMSIMSACTDDSIVIIESTANGCRYLKKLWDDAVSQGDESVWIPMFFPWFQDEKYEADYSLVSFLDHPLNEEEEELLELFKNDEDTCDLPIERYYRKLQWRRNKLKEMGGNLDHFHQEFPSTPEEAFITSGESVFNINLIAQRRRMILKQEKLYEDKGYYQYELGFNPTTQTRFIKKWKWVSDEKKGYITKFKLPEERVPYIVSTDPSGSGGDFTASEVIDNRNCDQVAELYKQKMSAQEIAIQTVLLGTEYNLAYLCSETNFAPEIISFYKEFEYPNLIVDENKSGLGVQTLKKYGFRTTPANRGGVISNLEQVFGVRGCSEDGCELHLIHSLVILKEAENFVTITKEDGEGHEKVKKVANAGAHDDTLMALAIAYEVRKTGQQSFRLLHVEPTEKPRYAIDYILGLEDDVSFMEDYDEEAMLYD